MTDPDYFFLFVFGTFVLTRLILAKKFTERTVTIKGFRVHHYMYGVLLILSAFSINNLSLYAIGFGLVIDELTMILFKGLGYKDGKAWAGNYRTWWSFLGALILILITYFFRIPFSNFL